MNKTIWMLENNWFKESPDLTAFNGVKMLSALYKDFDYVYYACDTESQLDAGLDAMQPKKGDILYIATHGAPNHLLIWNGYDNHVSMEMLSEKMGNRFSGCHLYLSACSIMKDIELSEFFRVTKVSSICGYTTDVDWIMGASLDLMVLYLLGFYNRVRWAWKRIQRDCQSLIDALGFVMVFPT